MSFYVLMNNSMNFFKKIKRTLIFTACVVITVIIFLIILKINITIPEFIDLLHDFGEPPPILTKIIIYTYQYWVILPIFALITSIYIIVSKEVFSKNYRPLWFLLSLLLIAIILIILTVVGMYAPIIGLE